MLIVFLFFRYGQIVLLKFPPPLAKLDEAVAVVEFEKIDGAGDDLRAFIHFDTFGDKVLIMKYAKLVIPKN